MQNTRRSGNNSVSQRIKNLHRRSSFYFSVGPLLPNVTYLIRTNRTVNLINDVEKKLNNRDAFEENVADDL